MEPIDIISIQDERYALIVVGQEDDCNVVRLLFGREAEAKTVTKHCDAALILASENGQCDVVRQLLNEADVNAVRKDGRTALMLASLKGHCDVVKLLLERGAGVSTVTQDGRTALMLASLNGHCDVVRLLLGREAEVNTVRPDGVTALMLASLNGHCDVVRLLLEREGKVNVVAQNGATALMLASQNGYGDVVRLLVERKADVNTITQDGRTALMLASKNGHHDVVEQLVCRGAAVNTATQRGVTAVMQACQNGHWDIVKLLIVAGADVLHVTKYGETAAMYIIFANYALKYDIQLQQSVEQNCRTTMFVKSHYGMSIASFALVGAFLNNKQIEWFDCQSAKSALQKDVMYAFLPNIFHASGESDEYQFFPYQGVEGKISIHTMATAVLCKLPLTSLQWLNTQHREKLVNMLGQTALHLLAMETQPLDDMKNKILLLTEKVGFSFSDRDNNGRVAYHMACLCLNTQFLLCGEKIDFNFRTNMLVQDHLAKTPLAYLYLLYNATDHFCIRTEIGKLIQGICQHLAMNTQQNMCTGPRLSELSNTTRDSLRKYFKANMTAVDLTTKTSEAKKMLFSTYDVASLFKCSTTGIVRLPDKQHIVVSVINLLHVIGTEMGKMNPLFHCVPELKGSVLEYTKCGELDELDISMKLVKFTDYFSIHIIEDGIKASAKITRKQDSGERHRFPSVEFCADFWQNFLKVLDTEVTRTYIKSNRLIIENCKRKQGFVGILNISHEVSDSVMLISVDITPSIVSDTLHGYTALLRPRYYDNKEVGDEFYQGLELSSSQKDWNFLKYLPPEVMCGYALVKMLRSVANTFQTETGRVYTAEDILPSYMVKTALLWILDPKEECSQIYQDLKINSVLHSESSRWYETDVLGQCQDLLHDPDVSGLNRWDMNRLLVILEKCISAQGNLTAREQIVPCVLATKHSNRQEQNGINLQWMQQNWKPAIEDISHQNEVIYSRQFYTSPETEKVWVEPNSDKKTVGQLSYHKIAYPDISKETAMKCRVWALRMLRILPHLLQHDGKTADGHKKITGVRNYYLPDQEIYARDKDLAIALCRVLEAVLE